MPSASASARPAQNWGPAVLPAATAKKKSCDPPYTLDDVGHRHYKPECMGLD
jgi:hypothetical protein